MDNPCGIKQKPYTIKTEEDIAVVVLAAGAGSRMGRIKQLLPWQGSTLLEHCLKTLGRIKGVHLHLVLGAHFEAITEACALQKYPMVVLRNPNWQDGLASSLHVGIHHIAQRKTTFAGVMVCLADQPFFTSDYYSTMISLYKKKEHRIVATGYGQKSGVPAIFQMDDMAELLALQGDRGAQRIMQNHKDEMLVLDAGDMNQDMDTPARYRALYELHHNL